MPKVYSVVEIRSKSWGMFLGTLTFFICLSMVLGILWPMERTKRKEAEEARERLTIHAHRLAQAKLELQNQLQEEKERKEAIQAILKQMQAQVETLQKDLIARENELRTIRSASADSTNAIEILPKQNANGVDLGRVVVGK